ncbi:DUF262 domain-containing HNH endonuclease family protein [Gammaproteobacteria bacterium]|nr:DUF262 domain-containing HNH endonuclease family protein [Gammaproteobacteria bacterium]
MDFEAKEKNLQNLLLLEKLNIPYNQRAFSWQENQIDGFYQDLKHCHENNKKHFLGTIITCQNQNNRNIIDVIDGQQRITAFFLFNAALVEKGLQIIKDKKEFTLKDDDNDAQQDYAKKVDQLKETIASFFGRFQDYKDETLKINPSWKDAKGYNYILDRLKNLYPFKVTSLDISNEASSRIKDSYDRIISHIDTLFMLGKSKQKALLDDDEILNRIIKLLEILNEDFKIVDCTVRDGEPNTIFDNLNTRGEPLSTLDVIRNAVFSELQGDLELQKKFNGDWMKIERRFLEPFNRNAQKYKDKDEITRHKEESKHTNNYWFPFGSTLNANLSNKKMNSQIKFALDNIAVNKKDPLERCKLKAEELSKYIPLYNALTQNYLDETVNKYPEDLKEKIFMLYRIKCPNTSFPFIFKSVDFYLKNENKEIRDSILSSFDVLESRIMRDSLTGKTPSKDFLLPLFKNIELYNHDFSLTRFFMNSKSYKFPKDKEIRKLMAEEPLDKSKRLSYLLEEMELDGKTTSKLKDSFLKLNYSNDGTRDLDVDHFMPQNRDNWKEYLNENGHDLDKKEYAAWAGNIGNLFLLHRATNSKKKNKNFIESKKIVSGDRQTDVNLYMQSKEKWTPDEIKLRSSEIANFFVKRWPFYDDHKKVNLSRENKKPQLEAKAEQKFGPIFRSMGFDAKYLGITINTIERNDATVTKDLYSYLLDNKILHEKEIQGNNFKRVYIRFFDQVDSSEIVMNFWSAKRDENRSPEVNCSFENLKDIVKANDVLGIFVKNGKLCVVNLQDIYDLKKRLEVI